MSGYGYGPSPSPSPGSTGAEPVGPSPGTSDAGGGEGWSYHDRLIIAHAVFACVAALILSPLGILSARYLRLFFPGSKAWFPLHAVLQSSTLVFVVVAFALGTRAVGSGGHGGEFSGRGYDVHHGLGLAVFIIVMVQGIFGILAHPTRGPSATSPSALFSRRHPLRPVHVLFGVAASGLLYAQVATGLDEWDETADSGTSVPYGIRVVFWVLLGVEVAAWIGGVGLEAVVGRKRAREGVQSKERVEDGQTE